MNTIWIVMSILIVLMFLLGLDINKKAFTYIVSDKNKNRYGQERRNQETV